MALEKRTHSYSESRQSVIPEWLYSAANLQVVDLLLKALIDNPGDIELSSAFANACTGQEELIATSQLSGLTSIDLRERAVASVDKMLASHREDLAAWVAHYEVVAGLDPIRAESDIRQLLSMAPNDANVLKNAVCIIWRVRGMPPWRPNRVSAPSGFPPRFNTFAGL
jgi:hypothetical protein